ncbi:MAG: tetratricopeptide repeat protein [Desulforhopalus sp.]
MRQICKTLCIVAAAGLLLQSCASLPPRQPVHYPPRQPSTSPSPPIREHQPPTTKPVAVPTRPVKQQSIAAEFINQAERLMNEGKLDLAASTLERGLRVAPKDALLWSQLAEVKLQQKNYQQAETLAAKSNSLAGSTGAIVQRNSWIIREARKRSGGY